MWREIPDYDGRYLINEDGDIIDLRPERTNEQWWWEDVGHKMLTATSGVVGLVRNGKFKTRNVRPIIREVFRDIILLSEEREQEIMTKAETQDSITYDIDEFNKMIWPNTLIKLYDKTYNASHHINPNDKRKNLWRKPLEVPIKDGKITIKKGHTYIGYGLTNLIYIKKNMIPYNGKPMEEPMSKKYMRNRAESTERKHITELY